MLSGLHHNLSTPLQSHLNGVRNAWTSFRKWFFVFGKVFPRKWRTWTIDCAKSFAQSIPWRPAITSCNNTYIKTLMNVLKCENYYRPHFNWIRSRSISALQIVWKCAKACEPFSLRNEIVVLRRWPCRAFWFSAVTTACVRLRGWKRMELL